MGRIGGNFLVPYFCTSLRWTTRKPLPQVILEHLFRSKRSFVGSDRQGTNRYSNCYSIGGPSRTVNRTRKKIWIRKKYDEIPHSCAIMESDFPHSVKCWGNEYFDYHTCAIMESDHSVKCWGKNIDNDYPFFMDKS